MYDKYPIVKIAIVNIAIYVIIWIALGWLFLISLQKLPQPWQLIVCGFIATLILMSLMPFYYMIKSLKDLNVIAATKLEIPIRNYNKYTEIFSKLKSLYAKGITEGEEINELMKQIPNLNEWCRFNEYHYQLEQEKWQGVLAEISKLNENKP